MSKPKNAEDLEYSGNISEKLLAELGEQTNGFLLFYLDENNEPNYYEGFSNSDFGGKFMRAGFSKITQDWADNNISIGEDMLFEECFWEEDDED